MKRSPKLLTQSQQEKLHALAKQYGLDSFIDEIYFGADFTLCSWRFAQCPENFTLQLLKLIHLLKYGDSAKGIKVSGVYQYKNISFNLDDNRLIKQLTDFLQSKFTDEDKCFYYNTWVIESEPDEETEGDRMFTKLMIKKGKGEKLTEGQLRYIDTYIHKPHIEVDNKCSNFYSEENMNKLIRYTEKELLDTPKGIEQKIGQYADVLFSRYKYAVFGYKRLDQPFIEAPLEDDEKEVWNEYQNEIRRLEEEYNRHNEAAYARLSLYKQHCFLFEVLFVLEIIRIDTHSNSEKYHYIRDCLRAYSKIKKK